MNNRIKELGLQAADWLDDQESVNTAHAMQLYQEKFAELIVRECAGIYDKIENGNRHLGTDDYLEAIQRTFFGVK